MSRPVWSSLLMLLALAGVSAAEEVYVPSDTPAVGSANNWPFNTTGRPDWRYQLVIPSSLLGGQAFTLTDIAFAPVTSGTHQAAQLQVRVSHSTIPISTTFDHNLPNPVEVLNARNWKWSPVQDTWSPFGLTSTFNYNGKDYLTIEIRYTGGTISGGFTGTCHQPSGAHDRIWAYGTAGVWSAATGSVARGDGLKIRLTVMKAQLIPGGTAQPGSLLDLNLLAPSDAGKAYQAGNSLGQGPIPIGAFKLELSPDDLLVASTAGTLPMIFRNYAGLLDGGGKALARLAIPALPALKGVRFYSAFVVLDPSKAGGVSQVSPNVLVTIQ